MKNTIINFSSRLKITFYLIIIIQFSSAAQTEFNAIINEINADSISNYIQHLESYNSRYLLNQNRIEIANWLKNKMESFGIENVVIDSFETTINHPYDHVDTSVIQYNVIAEIPGSNDPEEIIILGGHYDTYSTNTYPIEYSPGADDNASGTASVLECARVIAASQYNCPQTIRFIAFAAEEYMLNCTSGSENYAAKAAQNNDNIVLMINNDMIGYHDGNFSVSFSNYPSQQLSTNLAILSSEVYTDLNYSLWPSNWEPFADVKPFFEIGVPVVYMEETSFSPYYHTSGDIFNNLDINFCAEIVKCACGTILLYDRFYTTAIRDIKLNEIVVYPNPVSNKLNFYSNADNAVLSFDLINLKGELIETYKNLERNSIDVSKLNEGMYLLNVMYQDIVMSERFIKLPNN